jgi:hypothetical protein
MDTSLQDLNEILGFLDLAARRGAFSIDEFGPVGTAYSNLKKFVDGAPGSIPRERKPKAKAQQPQAGVVPENERGSLIDSSRIPEGRG